MCTPTGIPKGPQGSATAETLVPRLRQLSVEASTSTQSKPRQQYVPQVSSSSSESNAHVSRGSESRPRPHQYVPQVSSSGSDSTRSSPRAPPCAHSVEPIELAELETAELEARVLRLARACVARGRRAARHRTASRSRSRSRSSRRHEVPPTMDSDADDERDSDNASASPLRHVRRLATRAGPATTANSNDDEAGPLRHARFRPRTPSVTASFDARTRRSDARRVSRGATRALSSALRVALNTSCPSDDESESSSDDEAFDDAARFAFAAALWDL